MGALTSPLTGLTRDEEVMLELESLDLPPTLRALAVADRFPGVAASVYGARLQGLAARGEALAFAPVVVRRLRGQATRSALAG